MIASAKYKIILIGESTVGKTTIITRYLKGEFIKEKERTVNAISSQKHIVLNGIPFTLVIWDTAGEEKYHALAPIFYHGADGAIIVYDCTRKETFERAEKWFNELKESSDKIDPRIILVGNKIDLPDKVISSEEGNKMAQKYRANFYEVSALSGIGVENIFETLTHDIYNYKLQKDLEDDFNIPRSQTKKKLIISVGNTRFERRYNNDAGSCVC